jgi:iron(III) transport system ATP-binding protein
MSGLKRADVRARVEGVLETVGLTGLGPRMPAALSGGQQQRVAVARAVVLEPDVLLFDEPLSNLDAKLRRHVRDEIRELQQRLGLTAVYVTHDQEEALAISDRVIVMNAGRIAQEGTPRDLYERPASRFVADFIGDANLLDAAVLSVEGDVALVALGPLRLSTPARGLRPGPAGLAVRPHAVRLAAPGEPGVLPASVVRSVYLGARTEIAFDTEAGPLFAVLDSLGAAPPAGARVGLRIDERAVALLPSD